MKVSLIALFLVFVGGGGSSPSLVVVDGASSAAAAAHDVSLSVSSQSSEAAAASLRGSQRVMIKATDLRGLEKEEKCGKGEACDEDEADEAEKCKGKECDKEDEEEEEEEVQSADSEDEDQETLVEEEAEDDETTDASTGTTTTEETAADPEPAVGLEDVSQPPEEEEVVSEEAGAETLFQEKPQQPDQEQEDANPIEAEEADGASPPPAVDEGEDNEAIVLEQDTPSTEDVNIEASPEDASEATVVEADAFPGPTYTGASGTATSLTTGESGTSVASQSEGSGGLQPTGKALLSVALSGAFAAVLAIFLVRRRRRNSPGGALTPYSPTKDDSYFVDRDESMEATASSSGSPDKTSRELVMVGPGEITAIDQVDTGSQEGYECNDLAIATPTAVKPYGPEEPPVDEEAPPLKLSLTKGFGLTGGSSILYNLPRQVESPKSKSSAIVPHTPVDQKIVSSPQLSPDGDLEVYEDVTYAEDEANTIRAIVRKYQVENTVEM